MAIEVFNRYETKYVLNEKAYVNILNGIKEYMEADRYSKNGCFYTISNIYYDTYDNYLIRESVSKPVYKEKIRLRSYGIPKCNEKVYLEIKKKLNGLVNKRRTTLMLDEAYEFLEKKKKPEYKEYMNEYVLNELDFTLKKYNVLPKVYIAYDRKAFFGKDDRNFRITFDTNIRTRRYDLKLEAGDYGKAILPPETWLMELKTAGSIPLWFTELLSKNAVFKRSFSKYGTEYNQMLSGRIIEREGMRYA